MKQARVITAMVTPFNDEDKVDNLQLKTLIEFLISNGSEGLIVGGTTGEGPTLTHDEKINLFKESVDIVAGRVPVIVGTGSNSTATTIEFTQEVAKIKGVDAALVVAPYYNKPNQAGLFAHFAAVSNCSSLPVMIYNIPSRTGVTISVETVLRLARLPQIMGIKDCTTLTNIGALVNGAPADFLVYSGEDNLALAAKTIGAAGVVSVTSHLFGKIMVKMYDELAAGNIDTAAAIQRNLDPVINQIFDTPSPGATKHALNQWGYHVGGVRLPMVMPTIEEGKKLMNIITTIKQEVEK